MQNNHSEQSADVIIIIAVLVIIAMVFLAIDFSSYQGCLHAPGNMTCVKPVWMGLL